MSAQKRIAVGGFQHETNTFCAVKAGYDEFTQADAIPGLTRGETLFDTFAGMNLPINGYVTAASAHELVPLLWCSAEPSAHVTEEAFERITAMMCEDLAAHAPFDGVFLDLHGAMVVEHYEDGEGEILRRVREVIGADVPLVVSLDFHANVTEQMMREADAFAIYRTYPHLDMEATGTRAFVLLEHLLKGRPLAKAFRKIPFLLPLTAQCTDFEPNVALFNQVEALEVGEVRGVEFAEGFPLADIRDCGPSVLAYADTEAAAERAVEAIYDAVVSAEKLFDNTLLSPEEAIRYAKAAPGGPIVLADVQDNAGAGGHSDTVGLLRALVVNHAQGAVLALLHDPDVAAQAHEVGEGGEFRALLGAKVGGTKESPLDETFYVERLSDGHFACMGEMLRGATAQLGPMALLRVQAPDCDVRVIVGSHRFQCLDQAIFTHLGVVPAEQKIVAVKSTVHFRADFDPIAVETLAVESPGVHYCRMTEIPFRNLRAGVRLGPLGPPS